MVIHFIERCKCGRHRNIHMDNVFLRNGNLHAQLETKVQVAVTFYRMR